jgi:hypothetical protein
MEVIRMKNPGTDFHRREANRLKGEELARGWVRRQANAREWFRRAGEALFAGNDTLAANLYAQAALELQGQH